MPYVVQWVWPIVSRILPSSDHPHAYPYAAPLHDRSICTRESLVARQEWQKGGGRQGSTEASQYRVLRFRDHLGS